ncbi:DUF1684 domain-containing protein [Winogradskyella sp. PG-2]|uniref:DUF1684 domain-containing protein n=1 Tax=Winogradskyella sp. PG-2 TaxID=754409 RepID=UPI00045881B2|nr:DUF1684 domain-containing protein [Winogradskyella sp. PG-2]BAO74578.1 hypothetical protein WPG_0348 [Winogradskyella sp. PG-2]
MRFLITFLFVLIFVSCTQGKQKLSGENEWQQKMNADFKDATKSPLKAKDLKVFKRLDFFSIDSIFAVEAILNRTPESEWFNMKTTTGTLRKERIYGILNFELKDRKFQLNVYQGEEVIQEEDYKDYLFLPFLDNTNGTSSYDGGRYIDLRIPQGNTIELDFNKSYNPYCAYNDKYSCPIVPRSNYLDIKIEAGTKNYIKH